MKLLFTMLLNEQECFRRSVRRAFVIFACSCFVYIFKLVHDRFVE